MSVTSVARSGTPMRFAASATRRVGPTRVSTSPRCTSVAGNIATGVPARVIRRRKTLRSEFLAGEVRNRAAVEVGAGHDDVQTVGRHVEQLLVVDLAAAPAAARRRPCDQQLAPAGDRQRVPGLQNGRVISVPGCDRRGAGVRRTGALRARAPRASRMRCPASGDPGCTGIGAKLDVAARRRLGAVAALHLLFVPPAFLLEVDAHEPRRELCQEPGGADHADEIGDGKGHRNAVGHRGGFGRAAGRAARWRRSRCRWSPTR